MKISGLLRNQKVRIDPYQYRSGMPNEWDIHSADVHIDKVITNNKEEYRHFNFCSQSA